QTGQATQLLMSSAPISRADPTQIRDRVRVDRDSSGHWELLAAIDTASTFTSHGVVWDFQHTHTAFFGVHCVFTPSNADKFGFRYFSIDTNSTAIVPPPTALMPVEVTALSDTALRLVFDRAVDSASGADPANYFLNNGAGSPLAATV